MKLWPSRTGLLHGVSLIRQEGALAVIDTHCGLSLEARDSRNSRAARWLRAKQYSAPCPGCAIPAWKLEKYSSTVFSKRRGKILADRPEEPSR
jgi:pyrrolysyl-tRNA synthetase-like protein